MKKQFTAALTLVLILASITACADSKSENLSGTQSSVTGSGENSADFQNPGGSKLSGTVSEPQTPDGEPTFLICPDGVPVYTSEITEIYSGDEKYGDKKPVTLAEAEQGIRSVKTEHGILTREETFTIKCDGFAYGYIPMPALNRVDNPDKFEEDGSSYKYIGELSEDIKGETCLLTTEFIRIKNGDKFGSLTVKNAFTLFGTNLNLFDGDPEAPGSCVLGRGLEFDGEVELEGYICVTPTETLYGTGGDMSFYPNAESSTKIPIPGGAWSSEYGEFCHITYPNYRGYFGDLTLDVGNIHETEFDIGGVHDGDSFVKAKITLENIKYVVGDFGGLKFDLKDLEIM